MCNKRSKYHSIISCLCVYPPIIMETQKPHQNWSFFRVTDNTVFRKVNVKFRNHTRFSIILTHNYKTEIDNITSYNLILSH